MSDKLNFILLFAFAVNQISDPPIFAFYVSKCRIDFYNSKEIVKKISNYFTI